MPISRRDFEKGNFTRRASSRNEHPIMVFLRKNYRQAFKSDEIAERIKYKKSTVRHMLGKLKKQGLIDQDIPYYAINLKKNKK